MTININRNNYLLKKGLSNLMFFLTIVFTLNGFASNPVMLKVYEGFKFSNGTVTKSDDKKADITFYVNHGRQNAYSFALGVIGASKIKDFGKTKPYVKTFSNNEVSGWKQYANAPSPGYYVVLGADGKSYYLINVVSFKNQGKAASYWNLNFTWEKL